MSDDLTRLREIAEAVNRDNWRSDYRDVFNHTFDPPTVTALIERAERAERERDELSGELDRVRESNGPVYHDEVCAYFVMQKDLRAAALRAAVTNLADEWEAAANLPTTRDNAVDREQVRGLLSHARQLRSLLTDEQKQHTSSQPKVGSQP